LDLDFDKFYAPELQAQIFLPCAGSKGLELDKIAVFTDRGMNSISWAMSLKSTSRMLVIRLNPIEKLSENIKN
jgi:hypothetical protein